MQGPEGYGMGQPTPHPSGPAATAGQERSYGIVLLLYIVTLGIYGLYWHYKTHDELCRQVGRENKDKALWFWYIGIYAIMFVMAAVMFVMLLVMVIDETGPGQTPSDEMIFSFIASVIGFVVVLIIGAIAQLVLFIVYVLRQFSLLAEVYHRTGHQMRVSAGGFMGFYFGGLAAGAFVPILGWVAQPALHITAYYLFQENYNGVWRSLQQGGHVPSDAEWAVGGPAVPPTGGGSWDAPGRPGYPTASAFGSAPPTSGASDRPAAAPPGGPQTGSGFSVGARGASAPTGHLIHQRFECPRCHTHISASGGSGARVEIKCSNCGEGGTVTMPAA